MEFLISFLGNRSQPRHQRKSVSSALVKELGLSVSIESGCGNPFTTRTMFMTVLSNEQYVQIERARSFTGTLQRENGWLAEGFVGLYRKELDKCGMANGSVNNSNSCIGSHNTWRVLPLKTVQRAYSMPFLQGPHTEPAGERLGTARWLGSSALAARKTK